MPRTYTHNLYTCLGDLKIMRTLYYTLFRSIERFHPGPVRSSQHDLPCAPFWPVIAFLSGGGGDGVLAGDPTGGWKRERENLGYGFQCGSFLYLTWSIYIYLIKHHYDTKQSLKHPLHNQDMG